jgi:molecular chaperone DnaJ
MACNSCKSQGTVIKDVCSTCKGQGTVNKIVTESINIPRGVDSEMNIKVR